jgi:hypothetical protein
MICPSVAPPLRRSKARTVAFLLPSRALAAFGSGLGTCVREDLMDLLIERNQLG